MIIMGIDVDFIVLVIVRTWKNYEWPSKRLKASHDLKIKLKNHQSYMGEIGYLQEHSTKNLSLSDSKAFLLNHSFN